MSFSYSVQLRMLFFLLCMMAPSSMQAKYKVEVLFGEKEEKYSVWIEDVDMVYDLFITLLGSMHRRHPDDKSIKDIRLNDYIFLNGNDELDTLDIVKNVPDENNGNKVIKVVCKPLKLPSLLKVKKVQDDFKVKKRVTFDLEPKKRHSAPSRFKWGEFVCINEALRLSEESLVYKHDEFTLISDQQIAIDLFWACYRATEHLFHVSLHKRYKFISEKQLEQYEELKKSIYIIEQKLSALKEKEGILEAIMADFEEKEPDLHKQYKNAYEIESMDQDQDKSSNMKQMHKSYTIYNSLRFLEKHEIPLTDRFKSLKEDVQNHVKTYQKQLAQKGEVMPCFKVHRLLPPIESLPSLKSDRGESNSKLLVGTALILGAGVAYVLRTKDAQLPIKGAWARNDVARERINKAADELIMIEYHCAQNEKTDEIFKLRWRLMNKIFKKFDNEEQLALLGVYEEKRQKLYFMLKSPKRD